MPKVIKLSFFRYWVMYSDLDLVEWVNYTGLHYRPDTWSTQHWLFRICLVVFWSHRSALCQALRVNRQCFQWFSFIGFLDGNWGQNAKFCGWSCTSQNVRKTVLEVLIVSILLRKNGLNPQPPFPIIPKKGKFCNKDSKRCLMSELRVVYYLYGRFVYMFRSEGDHLQVIHKRYALANDVSFKDGPHIRRLSHNIIVYYNII